MYLSLFPYSFKTRMKFRPRSVHFLGSLTSLVSSSGDLELGLSLLSRRSSAVLKNDLNPSISAAAFSSPLSPSK